MQRRTAGHVLCVVLEEVGLLSETQTTIHVVEAGVRKAKLSGGESLAEYFIGKRRKGAAPEEDQKPSEVAAAVEAAC